MICTLGNAPILVPSSVGTSQGCIVLSDKGTCQYVTAFAESQHRVVPHARAVSLGLC